MFDKLVVSTAQRRKGRIAKFFLGTSIIYLSAIAIAFALSVVLSTPKLADTASAPPAPVFLLSTQTKQKHPDGGQPAVAPTKDPRSVKSFDDIITDMDSSRPPVLHDALPPGPTVVGGLENSGGGGPGIPGMTSSSGGDVTFSNAVPDPPRPPDPPKPQPRTVDKLKPLPVSSTVLQGKAITRVVPVYPELPKRIRMPGEVSVEVIISPDGRVESTRVVSGHPMFVTAALQAARGWRFEPTLLNGVAVRVTGVITFVFKLNE